jgi:hypothetical protein
LDLLWIFALICHNPKLQSRCNAANEWLVLSTLEKQNLPTPGIERLEDLRWVVDLTARLFRGRVGAKCLAMRVHSDFEANLRRLISRHAGTVDPLAIGVEGHRRTTAFRRILSALDGEPILQLVIVRKRCRGAECCDKSTEGSEFRDGFHRRYAEFVFGF